MVEKLYYAHVSLSRFKVADEEICILMIEQGKNEVNLKITSCDADALLHAAQEREREMETEGKGTKNDKI